MQLNIEKLTPITLAISGASGTVYALRTLQFLLENEYKVDLVISNSAIKVAKAELNLPLSANTDILKDDLLKKFNIKNSNNLTVWSHSDIAASISSGSYRSQGMIIVPCSMGTVSSIACGASDNLIARAADVCIKEQRRLVIVPREMPLSQIHLENLLKLSRCGVIVAPACPGFYHNPTKLSENIDFVVGKVLDSFGVDHNLFKRWKETVSEPTIA